MQRKIFCALLANSPRETCFCLLASQILCPPKNLGSVIGIDVLDKFKNCDPRGNGLREMFLSVGINFVLTQIFLTVVCM